jgi:hypothetical protein
VAVDHAQSDNSLPSRQNFLDLPSDDAPADASLSIVYFRDQVKAAFDETGQKDIFHSIMIGTIVLPMKSSDVGRTPPRRGRGNLLVFLRSMTKKKKDRLVAMPWLDVFMECRCSSPTSAEGVEATMGGVVRAATLHSI